MKRVAHERAICHDPPQLVKLRLAHEQTVGLQTHLSKHCVHKKKMLVLMFSYKHNIPKCWSIKDMSSFMSTLYNCVSASCDKLLFHELCVK